MSFTQNPNSITDTDNEYINQSSNRKNSQTIQHDLPQFRKGKKKQCLPEVDPNQPCFVHQLSVELITHIFSRLDPSSLATVATVCTYWRHIVMDDSCWKSAFVSYFGGLPFKRLSVDSWKTEYILRTHLLRKWTKGRGNVMTFNPKIGSLEALQVEFDGSAMLVASTEHGVAAKFSHRHLLYSTNESIRLQLTAVKTDKDRILWGFDPGFITLSIRTKSTSRLKGPHVQDVVLSGAQDGTVKVWDVTTTSCAWTLLPASSSARVPTCLEATSDHRIIIGYDDGSIVVWHANLHHIAQLNRNHHQEDFVEKRELLEKKMQEEKILLDVPISDTRIGVQHAIYDASSNMVIVAYQNHSDVLKFCTNTGNCVGVFRHSHVPGTSITCMKWDTSPVAMTLSLETALKPRSVNAKRRGGGISDLLLGSSSSSPASRSGQGTPSSHKTTRLLVTGDDLGTICLWNGDNVNQDGTLIKPIRVLTEHQAGISAIYIDACKIVTGSDDGWIYMWDPLTGDNINTLGNKIPKNAPVDRTDTNVMRVKNLWCNDYQGVATIGHQVKAWDFSHGKQFLTRRVVKQNGKPCNNVVRDKLRYEIGREVKESISKLESEKLERELAEREINKLSLGGLSDEEMLAYAMMLSEQENSREALPSPLNNIDFVDENDEELMKAVIASLEEPILGQTSLDTSANGSVSNSIDTNTLSQCSNNNSGDVHGYCHWPAVDDSAAMSPIPQEEDDRELRYILELSKTDK
ncbi:WD40-repeat-containing domain protein [Parasitella parasitica]|nr:WD40-repeat-containing domain protein [Parasitella parasitica]